MPRFSLIKQMADSKSVIGLNMLTLWDEFGSPPARWRDPLTELLADGTIRPVVAESFSFERAADAHRFITERRNVGKVVLAAIARRALRRKVRRARRAIGHAALDARHDVRGVPAHRRRARRTRSALRTIGDGVAITFGEYAERVRRLAGGLHALGVRRGDTVALHAHQPARVPPARHRGDAPRRDAVLDLQHVLARADRLPARLTPATGC